MNRTEKRVKFFQEICKLVIKLKQDGIYVMPFSFFRTAEWQKILRQQGKSRTLNSKHLQWLAIDLVIVKNGEPVWERNAEYEYAGSLWKEQGHTWGGDWKGLNDIYHFEWKD